MGRVLALKIMAGLLGLLLLAMIASILASIRDLFD